MEKKEEEIGRMKDKEEKEEDMTDKRWRGGTEDNGERETGGKCGSREEGKGKVYVLGVVGMCW